MVHYSKHRNRKKSLAARKRLSPVVTRSITRSGHLKSKAPLHKALLIGINYRHTPNQLQGCINDTKNVRDFLLANTKFAAKDCILMNDDQKGTPLYPTTKNIWKQLNKLVTFAKKSPARPVHLFLMYSGHGDTVKDLNGDEEDGYDEAICPISEDGGLPEEGEEIIDDDLKAKFVARLPPNVKLVVLVDACHSGTILDLKYNYKCSAQEQPTHGIRSQCHVLTHATDSAATCVLLSGCRDKQTSADADLKSMPQLPGDRIVGQARHQGAMTDAFLTSYFPGISAFDLIITMRAWIKKHKFSQVVQLSSGRPISTKNPFLPY